MSNTKLKVEATILNGKINIKDARDKKLYKDFIQNAPYGRYHMELRKARGIRTTGKDYELSNQNGYYWGVMIPRIKEYFVTINVVMTAEEINNGIKVLFLNDGLFSGFPKVRSTSELDKWEWEQTMKNIRDHFMENYHLHIPEPNEE